MATVFVPKLLRHLIPLPTVEVAGGTLGEVIARLDERYPGLAAALVEGDDLVPGIAVSINDQAAQLGLFEHVPDAAEVHFLPALSGG